MGSSVPRNTSTVTETKVPEILREPLQFGFGQARELYNQPSWGYPGASTDYSYALGQMRERALEGSPLMRGSQDYAQQVMSGQYLTQQNPYFNQALEQSLAPVKTQFMETVLPGLTSNYARAGRYGSGAQQAAVGSAMDTLGRNMSGVAAQMGYQDYARERGLQQEAAQLAPALAQMDYDDNARLMQLSTMNPEYDMGRQRLMDYMTAIGAVPATGGGGIATGPSGYSNNTGQAVAGAASSALSTYLMYLMYSACWVAEVLWGKDDVRTHRVRAFVKRHRADQNPLGEFCRAYMAHGREWSALVAQNEVAWQMAMHIWNLMDDAAREEESEPESEVA